MNDKQLANLFAGGSAPERDPAFALRVTAEIGRTRRRMRFLGLATRVAVMLISAAVAFLVIRLIESPLAQLLLGVPQFMGVPLPMVLFLFIAALLLRARFGRRRHFRFPGPGLT
ncbi:MAG: hypothetical protein ACTS5G_03045 [Burkholderiales bacterium]